MRMKILLTFLLMCISTLSHAETFQLYDAELLYSKMYAVDTEEFIKKDLNGKAPSYACHFPCSKNINIVFYKKGNKEEWFWSKDSNWYQYEGKLDLTGTIVNYDETRQIISLDTIRMEAERNRHQEIVTAPVISETELREKTRMMLKNMKKE